MHAARILFLGGLCVSASLPGAEAMYEVIEVVGQAEAMDPASGRWSPLETGVSLASGTRVRTGAESRADLAVDERFENTLRLEAGSLLSLLHDRPVRVSLDEGCLFLWMEGGPEVRVLTRDFLVAVGQGGLVVDSAGGKVTLRVFSESVQVFEKTGAGYSEAARSVEEGFRFSLEGETRMTYPDYLQWQAWYKKNDERRDRSTQTH